MNIEELERNWNELGGQDPLWAILTWPGKKGRKWRTDEFFETGKQEIADVMASTMSLGIPVERKRALDFGCGVGRLTQALAVHFDQVASVDIAASMLKYLCENSCSSKALVHSSDHIEPHGLGTT
jgi:2-polyprenyl-3-methyl-5-hydroxy-6-metoxy-1,4-benzoquinol methylase